jgi:hypothetical protein
MVESLAELVLIPAASDPTEIGLHSPKSRGGSRDFYRPRHCRRCRTSYILTYWKINSLGVIVGWKGDDEVSGSQPVKIFDVFFYVVTEAFDDTGFQLTGPLLRNAVFIA